MKIIKEWMIDVIDAIAVICFMFFGVLALGLALILLALIVDWIW